jgi:hypothetical protein
MIDYLFSSELESDCPCSKKQDPMSMAFHSAAVITVTHHLVERDD